MELNCSNKHPTFRRLQHFISYKNNTQRKIVLRGFIKLDSIRLIRIDIKVN